MTFTDKAVESAIHVLITAAFRPEEYERAFVAAQPCDSALVPLGDGPVEPCVEKGLHRPHRTAEGRRWTDPLDEES